MKTKTYKIAFTGRKVGAIGITYYMVREYQATNEKEAVDMLYTEYEHISNMTITNKKYH